MIILSIIIVIGCLINSIINGFDSLNIVFLVISVLFMLVQVPMINAKLHLDRRVFIFKISTIIFAGYVALIMIAGFALNPYKDEGVYLSKMKDAANLIDDKKYIQAQTIIDGLLKEDQNNVDVLILSGVLNFKQDKFNEAMGFYNKAYTISPYSENALYNLSIVKYKQYLTSGDSTSLVNALGYMETLANQSPQLFTANFTAGQMAIDLQQYKKAKYYLLNAQLLNPDEPKIYYQTAKMQYSIYEYKEALKNIKIGLGKNPSNELKKELNDLQTTIKNEAGGVFDEN